MNNIFVFDTNCLISASILPKSLIRKSFNKAIDTGFIGSSEDVFGEYLEVLFRSKFDKYFTTDEERMMIVNLVLTKMRTFSPTETFTTCRDPKDNKFLALAVAAEATCIITGDDDLLVLHPCLPDKQAFRGIPIVNASDFLNMAF